MPKLRDGPSRLEGRNLSGRRAAQLICIPISVFLVQAVKFRHSQQISCQSANPVLAHFQEEPETLKNWEKFANPTLSLASNPPAMH
jgi:hypothetical protein